jgi:hypothetical protein
MAGQRWGDWDCSIPLFLAIALLPSDLDLLVATS